MEMVKIFQKGEEFAIYKFKDYKGIKIFDCGIYYSLNKNYDSTIEDVEEHNLIKFDLTDEERVLINRMIGEILHE